MLSLAFGLCGLGIAWHIARKKRSKKSLVCPMRAHCDTVVYSQFSSFFGIPVERLGMVYYGLIVLGYGAFLLVPELMQTSLHTVLALVTCVAFLFSVYLVFIQTFALRQYCSWCLMSAGLCTAIVAMTFLHAGDTLAFLIREHAMFFMALVWLSLALGLGIITFLHVLYVRFLKDSYIDQFEAGVLRLGAQLHWMALGVLLASWFSNLVSVWPVVAGSPHVWFVSGVLGVILVASSLLDLLVMPRLLRISAKQEHEHKPGELARAVRSAHVLGPVVAVSWYYVFFFITLGTAGPAPWRPLVLGYLLLVLIGIGFGWRLHRRLMRTR